MNQKKVATSARNKALLATGLLLVIALIVMGFIGPFLVREVGHWRHYRQVEAEGKLKARFSHLIIKAAEKDGSFKYRKKIVLGRKASLVIDTSSSVRAGERLYCGIGVVNTGSETWQLGEHYVAFGLCERDWLGRRVPPRFRLTDLRGEPDVPNGDRIALSHPLEPREFRLVFGLIRAPDEPGRYTIYFQMVKEGVTWFGEERKIQIEVR